MAFRPSFDRKVEAMNGPALVIQQSDTLSQIAHGASPQECRWGHLIPSWLTDREFAHRLREAAHVGKSRKHLTARQRENAIRRSVEEYFELAA
jgi:hypothetical protein